MLSAYNNGPKKILTVSCLQFISTKELINCIRLYNYHWLSYWKHHTILGEENKRVKCAVVKCRSGFSPTKKEKELMTKGITPSCKKLVFAFSKEEATRRLWLSAINRDADSFMPEACAQKTTATAIFKPVSHPTISQWRKADQPTQPARVIPHVDCHIITIYLYYGLCIVGAMFKLYLYNITVFNSQFLSCWQSMAYGWSPTQPARVILTCIVPYYYASPTSGEAYRDRRLATNFEL